ncbi:hypothetical protein BN11_4950002 [Nostocoides australiense Ben110]|uniref:Spore protein YkvP/CgeB glycosyl transferase-like domain-containing protein n=1 Tax=Nostocoides australiense Ben110 TaxID=1193182 RepID=W6K097_9MICO|nr:hypothetical protein BN11_4950002 [Tetrasphaera australiensis Ben110]
MRAQAEPAGVHGSAVIAGLAKAGASWTDLGAPRTNGQVVHVELRGTRAAFDLSDSHRIHPAAAQANVIFKRCCRPTGYETDVRPLVPTAGYRFGRQPLAHHAALRGLDLMRQVRGIRRTPHWSWFSPRQQQPLVLFQVRAWDTATGSDPADRERVNEERASIIRALRAGLGPSFVGGFVPSPYARSRYPDLLSASPSTPREYAKLACRATVGVSTVGLHGSVPWKVAEYLAVGAAVVSEPLNSTFSASPPMVPYTSVRQCVESVMHLVENPEAASVMGKEGRLFFQRHIRPDQMVREALLSITT